VTKHQRIPLSFYTAQQTRNNNKLLWADITLKKTCGFRKEIERFTVAISRHPCGTLNSIESQISSHELKFVTCRMDLTIQSPEPNISKLIVQLKGLSYTEKFISFSPEK